MLTNEPNATLLPPGVNDCPAAGSCDICPINDKCVRANGELTVNAILREWAGQDMVPAEITALRLKQGNKGKVSHNDDEGATMLPPGVE